MNKELLEKYPCRNESECIWRVVDGEAVIISGDGQRRHKLNYVGLEIWKLCDGTKSLDEMFDKICEKYDVEKETAMKDTLSFIEELAKQRLLTFNATK